MNKLDAKARAAILHMLCEGSSVRSIARVTATSKNTVSKLLVDAGKVCAAYHDQHVRDVEAARIQVYEIWSFTNAKQEKVTTAKAAPANAGDTWTWTAIDADSKMIVSYLVGGRDAEYAMWFMDDLRRRLANRVQLTSDGNRAYLETDADHVGTSYVERQTFNRQMHMRRFTSGFSKKVENHAHAVSLHVLHYNFVRIHKALKVSPAIAAGITNRPWDIADIVGLVEKAEREASPNKRGAC